MQVARTFFPRPIAIGGGNFRSDDSIELEHASTSSQIFELYANEVTSATAEALASRILEASVAYSRKDLRSVAAGMRYLAGIIARRIIIRPPTVTRTRSAARDRVLSRCSTQVHQRGNLKTRSSAAER